MSSSGHKEVTNQSKINMLSFVVKFVVLYLTIAHGKTVCNEDTNLDAIGNRNCQYSSLNGGWFSDAKWSGTSGNGKDLIKNVDMFGTCFYYWLPRLVNFWRDASQSETYDENLVHLNLGSLSLIRDPIWHLWGK